jgi:serine/threonine protein kinase
MHYASFDAYAICWQKGADDTRMASIRQRLGPFHIHEEIDSIGEILVYTATDTRTTRTVLLYLLDSLAEPQEALGRRFLAEVEGAMSLRHPHLLAFHEYGRIDQQTYAASEPVSGQTLYQALRQRKYPFAPYQVATIIQEGAGALDHAYAQGWLHLGLNPNQIWVGEDGQAKVSGFGIPKPDLSRFPRAVNDAGQTAATLPEVTAFTAPEQFEQVALPDQRTDVYSLGAIAYAMLVGRYPFREEDSYALRARILQQPPPPPDAIRPGLPAQVVAVLRYALAKDPHARYATASEFANGLSQAQQHSRPSSNALATRPAPIQRLLAAAPPVRLSPRLAYGAPLLLMVLLATGLLGANSFKRVLSSPVSPVVDSAMAQTAINVVALAAAPLLVTPIEQIQVNVATPTARLPATHPTIVTHPSPTLTPASISRAAPANADIDNPSAAAAPTKPEVEPTSSPPPGAGPGQIVAYESIQGVGTLARTLVDQLVLARSTVQAPTILTAVAMGANTNNSATSDASVPIPIATPTGIASPVAEVLAVATNQTGELRAPSAADQNLAPTVATGQLITVAQISHAAQGDPQERRGTSQLQPGQSWVEQRIYIEGDANDAANLRAGPGAIFPIIGGAQRGQRFVLVACNDDCTWYQLASGEWIASFLINNIADPLATLSRVARAENGE